MKKKLLISLVLLVLLSTITFPQKIFFSKFNLKEIIIENNLLIKDEEIKKLLVSIYNWNLIFLDYEEIENLLMQNTFIESYRIKKKYPSTLQIKIFEKEPIAILFNKKKKFYLSKKIELIKFTNNKDYKDLPYVFGNKKEFKIFYEELTEINFPIEIIKRFTLFKTKRWDLLTIDDKLIKLPSKNYVKSLENYIKLIKNNELKKYKTFDFRINNQLILK